MNLSNIFKVKSKEPAYFLVDAFEASLDENRAKNFIIYFGAVHFWHFALLDLMDTLGEMDHVYDLGRKTFRGTLTQHYMRNVMKPETASNADYPGRGNKGPNVREFFDSVFLVSHPNRERFVAIASERATLDLEYWWSNPPETEMPIGVYSMYNKVDTSGRVHR
jgi:hypothetical protein